MLASLKLSLRSGAKRNAQSATPRFWAGRLAVWPRSSLCAVCCVLCAAALALPAQAQISTVRISEILADPTGPNTTQAVELFNAGSVPVSLNGAVIAANNQSFTLAGLADLPPGGTFLLRWNQSGSSSGNQFFTGPTAALNPAQGSLALFKSSQLTNPSELIAFVQWGAANQAHADLAAQSTLWDPAAFLTPAPEGQAMALLPGGSGRTPADWASLPPSLGSPNPATVTSFSGWALVGGQSIQRPALAFPSGGSTLELVSEVPGGTLQHHRFLNGSWSTLPAPGGVLTQPPALVASNGGTVELVAVGVDNKTYHSRFLGSQWTAFTQIGPTTTSLPVSLTYNPTANSAELVIVGPDNQLLHSRFTNGQWSGFTPVGGASGAGASLVFNPQGSLLELLFSALDRTISHTRFSGSAWTAPSSTGGLSGLTPAIVAVGDGTLDAALTAPDGTVQQNRFVNGVWRGWQPIAGLQSEMAPALVFSPESGTTELFGVGRDGQVRHAQRTGETWSAATPIGAIAAFPPAAAASTGGKVEVVVTGQDGNLWHNRFQAKTAAAEPEISFAKEIQPIFTANCSCHSGRFAPEGMNLAAGQAIANIVNVASAEARGLDRIEPGDPQKSYLIHKVSGTQRTVGGSGSRMPLGGKPLSDDLINKIRQWITQGAKNN
jgi:hypothetical protein